MRDMINNINPIKGRNVNVLFPLAFLALLPLHALATETTTTEQQSVQYSKPEYGHGIIKKEFTEEKLTEKQAEMKRLYTPREEFQLPSRLSEYEEPENLDMENGLKLNEGIPSVVQNVYKNTSKHKSATKVIGSNVDNTSLVSDEIDLEEYLDMDAIKEREANKKIAERFLSKEVTQQEIEDQMEAIVFPVVTDLKPTRMPSGRMELNPAAKEAVTTPMVFLGVDDYSLEWLQINLPEIKKFSPPIFVTQVDSLVDLQQLKRFVPDLQLIPVRGDEALKLYGVDFYPVMITKDGIFQ